MEALGRVELPTNGLGSVKLSLILKRFNKIALQNLNKYGRIRKLSANRFSMRVAKSDRFHFTIAREMECKNAPSHVFSGRLAGISSQSCRAFQ
jgi:hypothetical protein